jgi:histone-lysine N-methyltransferase SETMAR
MDGETVRIRDRSVIQFCFKLGYSYQECFEMCSFAYRLDHPSISSVFSRYEKFRNGEECLQDKPKCGRQKDENIIEKVSEMLRDDSHSSARHIANVLEKSPSTITRILEDDLEMKYATVQTIPHEIYESTATKRAEESKILLGALRQSSLRNFENLVTGDESWIYYRNDFEHVWISRNERPPTRVSHGIDFKKVMLTVFWSVNGFHVVKLLPKNNHINAEYFVSEILNDIGDEFAVILPPVYLHFDNAPSHTAKMSQQAVRENKMILVPHPPYSPDLAPSDFFLFGFLKDKLKGTAFKTPEEVETKVKEILGGISKDMLISVMHEWMKRLEKVIESPAKYYDE